MRLPDWCPNDELSILFLSPSSFCAPFLLMCHLELLCYDEGTGIPIKLAMTYRLGNGNLMDSPLSVCPPKCLHQMR